MSGSGQRHPCGTPRQAPQQRRTNRVLRAGRHPSAAKQKPCEWEPRTPPTPSMHRHPPQRPQRAALQRHAQRAQSHPPRPACAPTPPPSDPTRRRCESGTPRSPRPPYACNARRRASPLRHPPGRAPAASAWAHRDARRHPDRTESRACHPPPRRRRAQRSPLRGPQRPNAPRARPG